MCWSRRIKDRRTCTATISAGVTAAFVFGWWNKSNRDAIGATVKLYRGGECSSRMVKSGSSYLSQSETPLTFGMGGRDIAERVVISWPSGRAEEYKNLRAGKRYECVEGKGISEPAA